MNGTITVRQAAQELGVSPQRVRKLATEFNIYVACRNSIYYNRIMDALPKTCMVSPDMSVIDTCTDAVMAALETIWYEYDTIAIRSQDDAEKRTKQGAALRRSSEWVDGTKTRRKLAGTAGFLVSKLADLRDVIESMVRHGYWHSGNRIVIIGSNSGAWGDDMPELYATAVRDAKLLAIVGEVA